MEWKRYGWLGLTVLGVGCGRMDGLPDNQPVQMEARLERFEGCDNLEAYIEDEAVRHMKVQLTRSKPSYWQRYSGGGGVVWGPGSPVDMAPPREGTPTTGAPSGGSAGDKSSGPDDYTDTNNQVEGVDEADFVKNDGTRLFVLSGQKLYVHRSWPANALRLESTLQLEGWPREMFLEGNRVVVFSTVYQPREGITGGGGGVGAPADGAVCDALSCGYSQGNTTKVTVVDVSNLAEPRVTLETYLPGWYQTARSAEGSVRLVLSDTFRWPSRMRWYPEVPQDLWQDRARWEAFLEKALDELMVVNERLIREQTLEQWLPSGWHRAPDGSRVKVAYDCRDFHRSNTPTNLGFVSVVSLDPNAAEPSMGRTALVAEPGEVYASKDALYLASRHWWWWPEPDQKNYTYLHKFDITHPRQATYMGSGAVEGYLLNQFSMDEHQGVLRVATTMSRTVRDLQSPWGRFETSNKLWCLGQEGNRLKLLGQSEELAPGERIFSARFLGNRGYVVTFRQVDPLFTFDLSDPRNPRKLGELKVPGFSTYIHPLDEGHLLTIGVHVPEDNRNWRERALKLSLFDVTDPANPREKFTQLVGTASGWSEAQYEHKAFNYFPSKGLLAIPFADWRYDTADYWSSFISELRVYRVDATTGFSPVGALSMTDVYQTYRSKDWTWYWTPHVRRSVMADDYVYAITDAGVRVSHVQALGTPLVTTRFQPVITTP